MLRTQYDESNEGFSHLMNEIHLEYSIPIQSRLEPAGRSGRPAPRKERRAGSRSVKPHVFRSQPCPKALAPDV